MTSEESSLEETIVSTSYFSTTESFMQTLEFDSFAVSAMIMTSVDMTGDTFLEQFRGAQFSGPVMSLGSVAGTNLANYGGSCFHAGSFPLADKQTYLECQPHPAVILKPVVRRCEDNFIFSYHTGACVHTSAVDVLKQDLGFRGGPASQSQQSLPGFIAPFDLQEFVGGNAQCGAAGLNQLQDDDRFYLACQAPNAMGVLYTCQYGYFFSPSQQNCILGSSLIQQSSSGAVQAVSGIKVSSASPMFITQPCVSSGATPYPDYRYYISCDLLEGSGLYFSQSVWQCPFGLFYNPVHRKCTKASLFSALQAIDSWDGAHTTYEVRQRMDVRSGIHVPASSVPFHVPISEKEGKFPLRDIRYYYITSKNNPKGLLRTKLFICHSGFFFSIRKGQCVPGFMHEYILAGASYKLGVNLAQEANLNLVGTNIVGHSGAEIPIKIARLTLGTSAGIVNENPVVVFGSPVRQGELIFDLAPCSSVGYFAVPDYRFYFVCNAKTVAREKTSQDDSDSSEEDETEGQGQNGEDDDESFIQTVLQCPADLYFSDYFGFCVSPYIHQQVGLSRLDRYIWASHKLRGDTISIDGVELGEAAIPWEVSCAKDGKQGIRDPRYYAICAAGQKRIFLCPSNMYFSPGKQACVSISDCDCWYKAGYLMDPYPKNPFGQGINIFIHLDRAYLNLLRQAIVPVVRRSAMSGRNDGKAATLIKKLICFWREMEKYRTLQYQYTLPAAQRGGGGPIQGRPQEMLPPPQLGRK